MTATELKSGDTIRLPYGGCWRSAKVIQATPHCIFKSVIAVRLDILGVKGTHELWYKPDEEVGEKL